MSKTLGRPRRCTNAMQTFCVYWDVLTIMIHSVQISQESFLLLIEYVLSTIDVFFNHRSTFLLANSVKPKQKRYLFCPFYHTEKKRALINSHDLCLPLTRMKKLVDFLRFSPSFYVQAGNDTKPRPTRSIYDNPRIQVK